MPLGRPALVSDDGKLLIDVDGTLADKDCCCGCNPPLPDSITIVAGVELLSVPSDACGPVSIGPFSALTGTTTDPATDLVFYASNTDSNFLGDGGVGSWCEAVFNPAAGMLDPDGNVFMHADYTCSCPIDPSPAGVLVGQNAYLRHGTVNGDTGWHIVLNGDACTNQLLCNVAGIGEQTGFFNVFLGDTISGIVEATTSIACFANPVRGFTYTWTITSI